MIGDRPGVPVTLGGSGLDGNGIWKVQYATAAKLQGSRAFVGQYIGY